MCVCMCVCVSVRVSVVGGCTCISSCARGYIHTSHITYSSNVSVGIYTSYTCPMCFLAVQTVHLTSVFLQSIVTHSHPLVEDPSLIVKTKEYGVPLFLYGEHAGMKEHQKNFRRLGVNALVVDG